MGDFNDDYDDSPIVFKRSATSKNNNSNSGIKKSSSQNDDLQPVKQGSQVHSSNGQNSDAQKGKTVQASPLRSPLASQKLPTSSIKTPTVKSLASCKQSNSASVLSKPSSQQNRTTSVKREQLESDSEDDKPLGSRVSGITAGSSVNPIKKPHSSSVASLPQSISKEKNEDPDAEVPLSSRFKTKSNTGASSSKLIDSNDNKPVLSKVQQNGSTKKDNLAKKPSTPAIKRELDEAKSSSQQYPKKPKFIDSHPQAPVKAPMFDKDEDDSVPISQRIKKVPTSSNKSSSTNKKVTKVQTTNFKKGKKIQKVVKKSKYLKSTKMEPSSGEGQKWTTLSHNGVIFPPPYKPHGVKMLYKGKHVDLTSEAEEVATMFAVMLDTDYMNKSQFKENFMNDWRKILGKKHVIQNLEDCDFTPIYEWHQREEKKKQMTTEEKKALKEEKLIQEEKYMWAIVDGVKEKVGNFRVEPPGLFRGRGEHPKMGKLKKRIWPSDITINMGKGAPIPECPIPGQSWKEIRHDNTVTWLAYWNDPINPKEFKYVFLAASSSLKGQSDKEKYEKARLLKDYIQGIRTAYTKDFTSKDVTKRQIAVATYLIDKLALRAGNEKDDDEADTVGCCTLKVENVEPKPPNILKVKMSFIELLNEVNSDMIGKNLDDTFSQANKTPSTTQNTTTSKKLKTRGTSFSTHEDMLIVSAWLNISQDAIVGNEQRQGSYWERIYEYYITHKNFETSRTQSAIRNRWGMISAAVSKFCGCVSQIERLHQSGVTENDKIKSAMALYADNNKAQFNLDHCWNVLRYEQKWVHSLESPKKKVKTASTAELVSFEEGIAKASLPDVDERPPGRKAEKARLHKRKGMSEDNGEIKAILQGLHENKIKMHDERMEMQKKQVLQNDERLAQERVRNEQRAIKIAQERRRDDERILLVDTTSMPSHIATWYQLKQKEILERDGVL